MWRDVARCGEMWRDVARCGEMWHAADEAWLGHSKYGEMWRDVARGGERWRAVVTHPRSWSVEFASSARESCLAPSGLIELPSSLRTRELVAWAAERRWRAVVTMEIYCQAIDDGDPSAIDDGDPSAIDDGDPSAIDDGDPSAVKEARTRARRGLGWPPARWRGVWRHRRRADCRSSWAREQSTRA